MIRAVVWTKPDGTPRKITVDGHADYDEYGRDIICAAVSALTLTAANAVEQFTEDQVDVEAKEGHFVMVFPGTISQASALLANTLVLGLQGIADSYGEQFIRIRFEEV